MSLQIDSAVSTTIDYIVVILWLNVILKVYCNFKNVLQNLTLSAESEKQMSQASNLSSIGDGSQISADVSIHKRQRRQIEEHYWDIESISSVISSRSSQLSSLSDYVLQKAHEKEEKYWEGTNVEAAPPTCDAASDGSDALSLASRQLRDKRERQQKKEQYWEGYNEELPVAQQQLKQVESSRHRKHQHEKPYWA